MFTKARVGKKGSLLLYMLLYFSQSATSQHPKASISVYSVDLGIETVLSIPCNEFKTQFLGHIDSTVCYSPDTLQAITVFLKHIHRSRTRQQVDTRVRFIFIDLDGKETDICMDRFDLCVNGRVIRNYPKFYIFMRSLVPKTHLRFR